MHPVIRGSDVMVLNATFNNISVISVTLPLLVKEPGKKPQYAASHWQTGHWQAVLWVAVYWQC